MRPRRALGISLAGSTPTLLLVLIFGNWIVAQRLRQIDLRSTGLFEPLLFLLTTHHWDLRFSERSSLAIPIVFNLSVVVFLVLNAIVLFLGVRGLHERRGGLSAFLLAWGTVILTGAIAGAIKGVYVLSSGLPRSRAVSSELLSFIGGGSSFGLWYGWPAGLAALIAYVVTRPAAPVPPVPGYAPAPPRPPQGPQPQGPQPQSPPPQAPPSEHS